MAIEATIAGESCALVLRISGYERPQLESGADANWLRAEVELTASTSGRYSCREAVSLRSEELARFRDQLARVVETLDGEAVLGHMEAQVGCTVRLAKGVGELEAFVREQVGAELRVTGIRTDQSYLQQTLRELTAIVSAYPVRGDALG
jgi:hypothetical protein